MSNSAPSATPRRPGLGARASALAWPAHAFLSGSLGALFVATTFLVVDLARGRPALWTPAALASALFLREPAPAPESFDPGPALALVAAYTLLHGAVFVAFGWVAASVVLTREGGRRFGPGSVGVLALLLFAAFEISFRIFSSASDPSLVERLGSGWIVFANAGAAALMAAAIGAAARRRGGGV